MLELRDVLLPGADDLLLVQRRQAVTVGQPRTPLIAKRLEEEAQRRLEEIRLPPMPPIKEWRKPPDGREYARRYEVWELLAWYHHEVYLPYYAGPWNWIKRLWRRLFGGEKGRFVNKSPWQQLAQKDYWLAMEAAEEQLQAEVEDGQRRLELED